LPGDAKGQGKSLRIDLHMHTNASDGTLTNSELVSILWEHDIECFSVTDHDTIENSVRMPAIAARAALDFVLGAEISSTFEGREYHILSYRFDPENADILSLLEKHRKVRVDGDIENIAYLADRYDQIGPAEYTDYEYDRSRGGWDSLNYVLDKGIASTVDAYFDLFEERPRHFVFSSPEEVIQTVTAAGGLCILAHPSAYVDGDLLPEKTMKQFIEFGVSGFECHTPYRRDVEGQAYYVNFCRQNGVRVSAGSDYHGAFTPDRKLADPPITTDMIDMDDLIP
jgi:3',5'-nucleoside bisphosphate phosphatase